MGMFDTSKDVFRRLKLKAFGRRSATIAAMPDPIATWTFQYSPNMPRTFQRKFDFPKGDGPHYVVRRSPLLMRGQEITLHFGLHGNGKLVTTNGGFVPPKLRLFFQQAGDMMTAGEPDKRWWSAETTELWAGDTESRLTVKLEQSAWVQVSGQSGLKRPAAFQEAVNKAGVIGFCFGGDYTGYGSGVSLAGGAMSFEVFAFHA